MDTPNLLALYDQQQRIGIEYPSVRKEAWPHLVRFVRPAPGMNFIRYSRLDEAELDTEIQEQIAYFTRFDQPFSWEVLDHDTPPGLKERLVAHGFEPDEPGAIMVLDLQEAPPALLEPVTTDVRQISSRHQLDDVIKVEEQVWGGNFGWIKQRMGDHLEIPGYLSVYVAYVDGQAACTGWVYYYPKGQFAGLFGGSTRPEHRQRRLYTAVLATRLQEAILRGYRFLTIDASPMSQPILAGHGFRLLAYGQDYEWKKHLGGIS